MRIEILGPDDFSAMPWRNGRGTTVEMAREDDEDGTMLWRVSAADVVEPGAFSMFPGVDRILTLIEGPGFDLDFADHGGVVPVEPLVPVAFSGDWVTRAVSVHGPSRDLNVMTARGRASATVQVHHGSASIARLADRSVFLSLGRHMILTLGGQVIPLGPGQLALASGGAVNAGALEGKGVVIQIDIALVVEPAGPSHGSRAEH